MIKENVKRLLFINENINDNIKTTNDNSNDNTK